ncbi:hypothetical protein H7849_06360 [Alloacidobacterium dinghuense]|uniref:Adenylate cyclase n=1 Tax=Alloacidobacterium dinghuense TaxID=2763107 RepID=A0A7G8BLZ3_9BACT|nr:hypothetical protein [Alloacidobacterium dinghuense]QNI33563.1 hypothetical protein H7849_06360 [Alloacidobacterium dinghuense]
MVEPLVSGQAVLSDEEKTEVQKQLERLLVNPYFSHSRRFPSFLRFTVERTLSGQTDLLKERTLGIEIFGRPADYDTASDPIVRVTAAEIRKRIAQYYQEPGHENELRISLPSGSYVPHFAWPANAVEENSIPATTLVELEPLPAEFPAPIDDVSRPRRRWRAIAVIAVLLLISAAVFWKMTQRSGFASFWAPVLNSGDPVLFCVADQTQYSAIALRDAVDPNHQIVLKDNLTAVIIDDLSPIVKIAGILQANGKKYSLKGEGSTNLMDLRNGPTVFVGAFDNAWTLRLTGPLRYHFSNNPEMTEFGIVDSSASEQKRWIVNRAEQMSTNNYRDYAIVARFTDATTGKLAVVAAGIGRGGTIVAGEFLTDPDDLAQVARAAILGGNKKNIEIVLSTQIIDGEPGTPKIEATYFW